MTKPTQKTTQTKAQRFSFVLYVFETVISKERLPTSYEAKCTSSNISYHSRKLLSLGIIRKKSLCGGIYEALVSKSEALKRLKNNTKKNFVTTKQTTTNISKYKRVHSIQSRLTLPKFDFWFKILPKYLDKRNLPYDINKKGQIRLTMQYQELKHTFLLCKDCVIFYLPNGKDFISDDVDYAMDLVNVYINQLLTAFCGYFGKDLRVKGMFEFDVTRKHIAIMNNSIARDMRKKKHNIEVWVDGKLRVITDNSFNFDELEAITNKDAIPDVKAMELMIKDVITKKHTISDVKDLVINESDVLNNKIKELEARNLRLVNLIDGTQKAVTYLMEKDERSVNIERFIN